VSAGVDPGGPRTAAVPPERLLDLLGTAAAGVRAALEGMTAQDRRRGSGRPGQYLLDLVADDAAVAPLVDAGLRVLSEESGYSGASASPSGELLAVVDPVDGSTNAALGIPWYATSICVLDTSGPLVALVVNQATGTSFEAVRGRGATRDREPIAPSNRTSLRNAVIGVSGLPRAHPGWAQFRALGSAALDLCAVAAGNLDGYRVAGGSVLHAWDYLGGLLVMREAGGSVADLEGADLVVRDASPRRPVAASSAELLEELAAAPV
jgi:myo-inositol-1(or 4)-monophosphatase